MRIIGLTGGIGMGKSTVALLLKKLGFPIYSADHAVHAVLKRNGKAVRPVAKLFPDALKRGAIDRKLLGRAVFGQADELRKLEKIIHPLIKAAERGAVKDARLKKARAVVLEIPLLFETGADKRCDITFCVTAPRAVQHERVMARPGMTAEKLHAILKRQMSDVEKRRLADFVIPTGKGLEDTEKHLRKLLMQLGLMA